MRRSSLPLAALLAAIFVVCMGCGRKAPPRWVEPSEPLPPESISAVTRPHSITLTWPASPNIEGLNIKGYVVYRSPDGGKFEEIGFVSSAPYIDNSVTPDTRYTYRIVARPVGDGPESKPVEIRAWPTIGLAPPEKPTVRIEPSGMVLEWAVSQEPSGYRVYKFYTGQTAPVATSGLLTAGEYRDKADTSRTVIYKIRAVLEGDGIVSEGPASEAVEVAPDIFAPSTPKSVNAVLSEHKMLVFWDVNPEVWVSGYRVYRAIGDSGSFEPIGESKTLALPDNNPPAGKLRYRVSALAGNIESSPSNEAVVIVRTQ